MNANSELNSKNGKSDRAPQSAMRIGITIVILAVLAVSGWYYGPGVISGFMWGFEGHDGLPSCDSSFGQTGAKRAFENSPFAKTNGIEIVAMSDVKTISADPEKVVCKATVILNSSKQGIIDYSFLKEPSLGAGQYFVQALLELETFRPYP